MKGFMLASPNSGAGKTVVTMALLRALEKTGLSLAPAKAGPDYIDPAFHQIASRVASINLDGWAMRPDLISALSGRMIEGGKTVVVEAMMGLFDGAADGTGSAADIVRQLTLPVILIVDCAKMSHSVAALVHGFNTLASDIYIAGIILNKVGSDRHELMLRNALEPLGIAVVGAIRRSEKLHLMERHLGLVQAEELDNIEQFIEDAATYISQSVDLEQIIAISHKADSVDYAAAVPRLVPLGQHIAIARDNAFRFTYPHILAGWTRRGAQLSFFSPLEDEAPAKDADAVYLPGGYPELFAGKLASATKFKTAMQQAANTGKTIYGECGGYMVLGEMLEDKAGEVHEMLGLLPLETSFREPRLQLGYRKLTPVTGFPWKIPLRGHEFHYANILRQGAGEALFKVQDALDSDLPDAGFNIGRVAGSFIHVIDMDE